ncbi:MAG TPA: hypothetical protein PKY35_13505 [Candidatus Hydrogenedentes bacterium]|nr:hypothetical protein [Candidatus Hydrogenedentota bacterium]HOL78036.1 hypothetical protein [Candidatus Hydrogenedentota bacterium]HPO84605.1 hypothetical protein [Candidatus Hydrogenedentota bacterium]
MKSIVLPLIVFLLAFGASLVGVLAATGNLNKAALDKMLGKTPPPAPKEEAPDELDAFAAALKEKEQQITTEQKRVDEEKRRLRIAQDDMSELTKRMEQLLQQITQAKEESDKIKETRTLQAAQTLAGMDPKKAAAVLNEWPADRAAEVLRNVKDKDRSKILDQMDPAQAAQVLENLKSTTL